jgi:DNA-binding CsgD family transcriptional regulator
VLDILGLDAAAFAVYRQLLRAPGMRESELAPTLGLDHVRVSTAIGTLKRLALVRPCWDDADGLVPAHPRTGLAALLTEQETRLLEQRRLVEEVRGSVDSLTAEYSRWQADASRGEVEFLEAADVAPQSLELAADATREVLAFRLVERDGEAFEAARAVDTTALDRGLTLRALWLTSIGNSPAARAHLHEVARGGGEVRTVPVLPARMDIFDGTAALLPADAVDFGRGAVLLRGGSVLGALQHLFELMWSTAVPLEGPVAGRAPGEGAELDVSSTERAVLLLLSQGMTDEAVARKLGVSLRTVRRITAGLMKRLGTQSRFAAGVRVAELGLL